MKLSGRKSIQSLNHYNRPSLEQQKHVSFAQQLSNIVTHAATTFCVHSVTTSFRSVTVSSCCSSPPHSVNSGTLPGPVVSQIQPNLPAILSAVQSHSPVLGQVQTPASLPSPLQQLIIKEQMKFALNLKTKHPQVIYSDSEDFYTTIWIVILYLVVC